MPLEPDRRGRAGDENLFLALGERDDRDAGEIELLHRRERGSQLAATAVDDDEVRCAREALVRLALAGTGETAGDHLADRADVVLAVEAAHGERAVVRVLRLPVHEHDHRRDDRLALDVRDVEALDPQRQALEVQALAELLERSDAAQPLGLAARGVRSSATRAFSRRELDEAALLATRRRPHFDARAAPLREELGDRLRVPRSRPERAPAAGCSASRRSTRRRTPPAPTARPGLDDVLEMEAVAVDHLPVAKREDLHRGAVALDRQPDHVDGSHGALVRRLPLGEMPDREEPVSVPRRLLEALVSRRLLHA